jgi:hypothetical protein
MNQRAQELQLETGLRREVGATKSLDSQPALCRTLRKFRLIRDSLGSGN